VSSPDHRAAGPVAAAGPAPASEWATLFRVACSLVDQANIDHWTFGGGTAMMLQIDHRESRDVDFFLDDPQLLGLLDPALHDFEFEIRPTDYRGDGARALKFIFGEIGEIDFIVAAELTTMPAAMMVVENRDVLVETIPEIITKKVFHRCDAIQPRDLFDLAAASRDHEAAVIRELRPYRDQVTRTLATLSKLNPEMVNGTIAALAIKEGFKTVAKTALVRSKEILRAI
jgi:Nucleotidyl transferase AbiEii toxin, Type IV TA system